MDTFEEDIQRGYMMDPFSSEGNERKKMGTGPN